VKVIARFWWIVAASILLVAASVRGRQIQVGTLALDRSDPNALALFVATGLFGAVLLIAVLLVPFRPRIGLALCQWWGAAYSLVMLSLLYANFALLDPFAMLIMGVFSAAWYWGVSHGARTLPR
jgi:hypothetical protein